MIEKITNGAVILVLFLGIWSFWFGFFQFLPWQLLVFSHFFQEKLGHQIVRVLKMLLIGPFVLGLIVLVHELMPTGLAHDWVDSPLVLALNNFFFVTLNNCCNIPSCSLLITFNYFTYVSQRCYPYLINIINLNIKFCD